MKRQKIQAIEAAALILGTILTISISAESIGISSDDFMHEKSEGLGRIEASVKLLYGSSDLPLVRPFKGVTITATQVTGGSFSYMGKTDSNGRCVLKDIHPGLYKITAERENHVDISSGPNKYKIVKVSSSGTKIVGFTLTPEGSPWNTKTIDSQVAVISLN